MIYLDNAATTKVSEEVILEMNNYHSNNYANPSSKHIFGKKINNNIAKYRNKVAELINSEPREIYFTSGSTEGITTILRGYVETHIEQGQHIITTKVEHKAVLETCSYLESIGLEVTYLDVNSNGLIDLEDLKQAITESTLLVSILWVNNETGVMQDIKSISSIINKTKARLFLDATQAVGKLPVDVKTLNIDMLCMSAHKFHGPKGIGAIFIKEGIKINPLLFGGGQERGLRSGTSNTAGIVGLATACEIADTNYSKIEHLRNYLEEKLNDHFDCQILGINSMRSPYISNVIINGIDADVVIGKLNDTIISSGSACNSEIMEASHVIKNMGVADENGFGALRFSLSKYTTYDEIDMAIEELKHVINFEISNTNN